MTNRNGSNDIEAFYVANLLKSCETICSHELSNVLVVASLRLVGDLSHEEVLDEDAEEHGGGGLVLGRDGGGEVGELGRLLGPVAGVDGLVHEAGDVARRLGNGLEVVVDVALVEHVSGTSGNINVLLDFVEFIASGGALALALGCDTRKIVSVGLEVGLKISPEGEEAIVAGHAIGACVGGITLHVLQKSLLEGSRLKHGGLEDGENG